METKEIFQLRPIDWKWLVVSFCFLVLFHLFVSFLATGFLFANDEPLIFLTWLMVGVGVICAVIGFQSKGITVLEPALASIIYALILLSIAKIPWKFDYDIRSVIARFLFLMGVFVVGCFGAAFGEWLQMRKERRSPSE
jgi:hypothetical protein